jgi:rhodanese-related sulfurtransferase
MSASAGLRAGRGWPAILGLLAVALVPPGPASAGHGPDTTILTVKAAYVRRLMEAHERIVLVDLRPAEDYARARLPGARSVPAGELRRRHADIPRVGLAVLYCACPLEEIRELYMFLRERGYRNVVVMDEGFSGWTDRGYPVEDLGGGLRPPPEPRSRPARRGSATRDPRRPLAPRKPRPEAKSARPVKSIGSVPAGSGGRVA